MKPDAWNWRALAGLALAMLTAAGLRFWALDTLPPGHWYDEAHKSIIAVYILRGQQLPVYITDFGGIEAGFSWLLAGWYALFGPATQGGRALSALLGVLAVPLTGLAAWAVYPAHPQRTTLALAAAFALAGLFYHVLWSRSGYELVLVSVASAALLAVCAWAGRRRTAAAWALAGVLLGLSQYIAPAARVLPLQAVWVLALFASAPEGGRPRRGWLALGAALAGAALAVYAPLGGFFWEHPERFFGRLQTASAEARAGGLAFLLDNVLKVALMFNFRGDALLRHNLSGRPMLDALASLWLWAGWLSLARARAHWRGHAAVLGSLGINVLTTVLSDGAPGFGRSLGAAPMTAICVGLGVAWAWERAGLRWWARGLIAASLAASIALTARDYFLVYPRQPGLFDAYEVGLATLTRAATAAAPQGAGYLMVDQASQFHPATRLAEALTPERFRVVPAWADCLVYPARTTAPVVMAALAPLAARVREQYPAAAAAEVLHEPDVYLYGTVFTLPAGAVSVSGAGPAQAVFGQAIDLLAVTPAAGPHPAGAAVPVRLRWRAAAPIPARYTVFVHLTDPATPFLAGADGEPCQTEYPTDRWQTGEVIEHTLTLTLPAALAPGAYDLAVGLYDWTTGARLPLTSPTAAREPDRAFAAVLRVR